MSIKNLVSRRSVQAFLAIFALSILTLPAIATLNVWSWSDKSWLLPIREGTSLHLVSERTGSWLVSDGSRLYLYDGAKELRDLTPILRSKGMLGVSSIFSDGSYWLISYQPLDREQPLLWLTDGENWIEATDRFSYTQGGIDAIGHDGTWYVRGYNKPTSGRPSTWTMYRWNGMQTEPQQIELPLGNVSPLAAGCVKDPANSLLCTGVNGPLFVNGNWYFIGGLSQLRDINGEVKQSASAHIWKLNDAWREVSIPTVKFVSGVWQSEGETLIATSDVTSNPFAADRFWVFDGQTMRDISSQAFGAGLLSIDAREIKASWNGRAWVILAGKNVVRFDGQRMERETSTRDLFRNLASAQNGLTVFVGVASTPAKLVPSAPLMAKLVLLEEDFAKEAIASAPEVKSYPWISPTVSTETIPESLPWTMDLATGIAWATWIHPNQTVLKDEPVTFHVAARAAKGLQRIELWVNGAVKDACAFDGTITDIRACHVTFTPSDLPNHADVFVNARVTDSLHRETWTSGTTFHREGVTKVATSPAYPTKQVGPIFRASAMLTPAVGSVVRGDTLNYRVLAQNNTSGLHSVQIFVNGQVKQACNVGIAVDPISCTLTLDTSAYPQGTTLTLLGRATDNHGQEIWTNGASVLVRATDQAPASNEAPLKTENGMSVWSWMNPTQEVIAVNETASYTVGAWAPSGIKMIEMIADGVVRKTCVFGTKGTKECTYTITTNDFSDEHLVVMNARVTDMRGDVSWSDVRTMILKRSWNPLSNPSSYAQVISNFPQGYAHNAQMSFTIRGWSPRGVDHIDLFVNGQKVLTCPSDRCLWTTPLYTQSTIEYQVKIVDNGGQEAWSGLYGLRKK